MQQTESSIEQQAIYTAGLLRTVLQLNIGKQLLLQVPQSMMTAEVYKAKSFLISAVDDFALEVNSVVEVDPTFDFLVHMPSNDKVIDIARLLDTLIRIGAEEKTEVYNEFLGIIIDALVNTFYAQSHRKRIHFGKYKAIFSLIAEEIRRDVNKEPGLLWYKDQSIWFKAGTTDNEVKISGT